MYSIHNSKMALGLMLREHLNNCLAIPSGVADDLDTILNNATSDVNFVEESATYNEFLSSANHFLMTANELKYYLMGVNSILSANNNSEDVTKEYISNAVVNVGRLISTIHDDIVCVSKEG